MKSQKLSATRDQRTRFKMTSSSKHSKKKLGDNLTCLPRPLSDSNALYNIGVVSEAIVLWTPTPSWVVYFVQDSSKLRVQFTLMLKIKVLEFGRGPEPATTVLPKEHIGECARALEILFYFASSSDWGSRAWVLV